MIFSNLTYPVKAAFRVFAIERHPEFVVDIEADHWPEISGVMLMEFASWIKDHGDEFQDLEHCENIEDLHMVAEG